MKVLIAPDKFKGSLQAQEVCAVIREAIGNDDTVCIPMADGGEGTCAILTEANRGYTMTCDVVDPLGRSLSAAYGVSRDGRVAYVEMAAASGLYLLQNHERDPLTTSTVGTGMMIRHAVESGVREIILTVGGSATCDGGMGMAAALGYVFLDRDGKELHPSGAALKCVSRIEAPGSGMDGVILTVLCDVANPLLGAQGAAQVFAPQKGADTAAVHLLEEGLCNLASVVETQLGRKMDVEFGGAGGGIAAGARAFLNGTLVSGIHYIMDQLTIEDAIRSCDLVITGEGSLDRQSLSGKVVSGIGEVCRRHGKPFIIFCGVNKLDEREQRELGAVRVLPLVREGISEEVAMTSAKELLNREVRRFFRERYP
jgi:glycerate kinase